MITNSARPRVTGFTLLELVIALALLSMLVGMVFGTAKTALSLGNTIVETQNKEMLHQAFFELLSKRFSALPGNTRLDLKVQDSGSHYISDLTLQNVPLSFTWGGQPKIAKAIQLSTVKRRSGYLDIVLRYYENEILPGSAATSKTTAGDEKPMAEIVLLEDVAYFEWRVLDGRSMEWQFDWDIQGRLPLQMELTMAIGAKGEEIRQVFWIPTKQNPEVAIRQAIQQAASESNGAGGGNNDGGNGNNGGGVDLGNGSGALGPGGSGRGPGSGGGGGGGGGHGGGHGGGGLPRTERP